MESSLSSFCVVVTHIVLSISLFLCGKVKVEYATTMKNQNLLFKIFKWLTGGSFDPELLQRDDTRDV